MKSRLRILSIILLTSYLYVLAPFQEQHSQANQEMLNPQASDEAMLLPNPHLGYGIHVAPHTSTDMSWLGRLNMEWVKVYTYGQAEAFKDTRNVLFRMDLSTPPDWEQFKRDIQARTRELDARGVDAIEVHNEPNLSIEWRDPNAWEYTQLLRVTYTEIKATAPHIIVVSAGLAPTETTPDKQAISDIDFAREMFENDAGLYFDVFGYHNYGFASPPEEAPDRGSLNFRRAEIIRDLMVEYGLELKPMWVTEFGWLRNPAEDGFTGCNDGNPAFRGFGWLSVSGQTQADYIVRSYDYADKNWPWMGVMFLWNLNWSMIPPEALNVCSHMRFFSLLKANGEPTVAMDRVISMPRRPIPFTPGNPAPLLVVVDLDPEMALVADEMTVEVGVTCPGIVQVGEFDVVNVGKGGTFSASVAPAEAISGPNVTVSTEIANPGDSVTVYADTTGLDPAMYVIFINVRTELNGVRASQNLRGFVIVSESFGACQ